MDLYLIIELFSTRRCNICLWFKMLFYLIKHNSFGSLSRFLLSIHSSHLKQIHTRYIYFHESLFLLFFLWPKKVLSQSECDQYGFQLADEWHDSRNEDLQQVFIINAVNMKCLLEPRSQHKVKWVCTLTSHGNNPGISITWNGWYATVWPAKNGNFIWSYLIFMLTLSLNCTTYWR